MKLKKILPTSLLILMIFILIHGITNTDIIVEEKSQIINKENMTRKELNHEYIRLQENYRILAYHDHKDYLLATNVKKNNILYVSQGHGQQFEVKYKFPAKIQGIHITDRGSILVSVSPNRWENSSESAIYRSEKSLNDFQKVLIIKSGAALNWNFASLNSMVFVSEYGYKSLPDNARRIYRSLDDGKTWAVVYKPSEKEDYHNHKILIDKTTETIYQVYGDDHKGILKSTDQGESFKLIQEGIHPTSALMLENKIFWGLDDSPYAGVVRHNPKTDSFFTVFKASEDLGGSIYDMVKIEDTIYIFLTSYDFQPWAGSIFYTNDMGKTWHEHSRVDYVPNIGVGLFNVIKDDQYIYVSGSIPVKNKEKNFRKFSGTLRYKIK